MVKDKFFLLFLLFSFKLLGQEYLPKSEGEIIKHKYYTLSYNEDHELLTLPPSPAATSTLNKTTGASVSSSNASRVHVIKITTESM